MTVFASYIMVTYTRPNKTWWTPNDYERDCV